LELKFKLVKLSNVENQEYPDYNEPLKIELEKLPDPPKLLSPNNPPWNSLMAVLFWFASVFFIAIIPTICVFIYLGTSGANFRDASGLKETLLGDPNAILANMVGIIPAHLATILLAWIIVTYGNKYSFKGMLGWEMGGFKLHYLIGIALIFFILAVLIGNLFPEKENDLLRILKSSRSAVLVVAFMATFTAPLVEEVVYRGIMYSAFQRTMGVTGSVILVTLLFALVHVPQYYPSYSTIFVICLLSLILTLIRAKSNNLLPCIILHTIFNGIQSSLLVAEPYLKPYLPPEQAAFFIWFP
jgi:uncharacterized protein